MTSLQWLKKKRSDALGVYNKLPMPAWKRDNIYYPEWEYTDVSSVEMPANPSIKNMCSVQKTDIRDVVFTDMSTAVKEHPEIVKKRLSDLVGNKFEALNTAFWNCGIFLYVPEGVEVKVPLQSFFTISKGALPRNLIIIEPDSSVTFCEEYTSGATGITSAITEIFLGKNAKLDMTSLQNFGRNFYGFSKKSAYLERNSALKFISGEFGGRLVKSDINVHLNGKEAKSEMFGMFFSSGSQHLDISMNSSHSAKDTHAKMLTKGALADNATAVYKGSIKISKSAKKSSSQLSEEAFLLSSKAHSYSVPSLQIENNDVEAGHSASLSQLDEEQLLYMMSRGISRNESEKLLVEGFFSSIINRVPEYTLRAKFRQIVMEKVSRNE